MCGIIVLFAKDNSTHCDACRRARDLLHHRGPDYAGEVIGEKFIAMHTRLAIVGTESGEQPFTHNNLILVVNGEIYNHESLRAEHPKFEFTTGSDCEVILPLFERYLSGDITPSQLVNKLDGVFGFVAIDRESGTYIAARDAIGVMPLFYSKQADGTTVFASEAKAIKEIGISNVQEFPAGSLLVDGVVGQNVVCQNVIQWYTDLAPENMLHDVNACETTIRSLVVESVRKRMMADVPFGVLLSGGLDSSIIAACAASFAQCNPIHTFSIGLEGSPDLLAAQKVSDYLKTNHHECVISLRNVIDALPRAVWFVESYDVATIRSAVVMILLAEYVNRNGFKMVLGGDGADEIFAGYEYFQYAPSATALHEESMRKVQTLSRYDCKRGNHSMMAGSVEYRCPFLDKALVKYIMTKIRPADKLYSTYNIEKYILRAAFKDDLPDEIIWRSKVQFSAGCGEGIICGIIAYAEKTISDELYETKCTLYPNNTPLTKEAFMYREMFEQMLPGCSSIVSYEPSLNCSTKHVVDWFPEHLRKNMDPCGIDVSMSMSMSMSMLI